MSMIIAVADTRLPDDQSDGLWFETSDAHGVTIRDEDEYNGVRITLGSQLSTARMRFHVDVKCWRPDLASPSDLSLIHISEPTRRTPISYAVFCLKKKK